MDKSTFERLIQTPSSISSNEALLLEDLAEAFPYCQTAHVLLAKESQQKRSMLYPKKLKKASTYMLDRNILHQVLHTHEQDSVTIIDSHPTQETAKTEKPDSDESIATPLNISILQELEETIRQVKESRKLVTASLIKISIQPTNDTITPGEASEPNAEIIHNFHYRTETRLGDELCFSIEKKEPFETAELLLAYLNKEGKRPLREENIQTIVIQKFLAKEPKMTRSISNTFLDEITQDLSRKSTELKNELVTENFAQILVKQNKIEKAKEVYKKLMLKYPDKSAYFGAKLNELENR